MAKIEDLKEVLKETLENKGVLNQVRARIRAEVFNTLNEQTEVKPTLSNENFLINELIREYLDFNKYNYTKSVLTVESGQPSDKMDRRFLLQQLNMEETQEPAKLPLLYGMLSHFLQQRQQKGSKNQQPSSLAVGERNYKDLTSSDNSLTEDAPHNKKLDTLITYRN